MERIKTWVILGMAVVIGGFLWYAVMTHGRDNTQVLQPAAVGDPARISQSLHVSKETGAVIAAEIIEATKTPPVMSWTVTESNTQAAAKAVEKQIERQETPPMPAADKTIVTPRETKVDVYRITLDKHWEVGIGYGNHNGESYLPVEVQRNYSKNKAVAAEIHMDMNLKKVSGYEIKHVWRF